jgi:hypothetical protein
MGRHSPDNDHHTNKQDHAPSREASKFDEEILGLRCQSKNEQSQHRHCHHYADDPENQRKL